MMQFMTSAHTHKQKSAFADEQSGSHEPQHGYHLEMQGMKGVGSKRVAEGSNLEGSEGEVCVGVQPKQLRVVLAGNLLDCLRAQN